MGDGVWMRPFCRQTGRVIGSARFVAEDEIAGLFQQNWRPCSPPPAADGEREQEAVEDAENGGEG